jgi:hypothetical protein
MAKITIAYLKAQLEAQITKTAAAEQERDFFKQNSLRKEGVIQMLQGKVARLERGQVPGTNTTNWAEVRQLSAQYCRKHGVKSCTIEQALSLRGQAH